ncbi:MAG: hypothetical protein FJW37_05965 [Acidobacteria bacterium]|nr:hypothetical protein [Acidobacteriota bacterium]
MDADLLSCLQQMEARITGAFETRFTGLEGSFTNLESRVGALESRLIDLEARMDFRFNELENRLRERIQDAQREIPRAAQTSSFPWASVVSTK